jgi:hypothetical protein
MGGRATHNVALEAANKAKDNLSGGVALRANMLIHGLAFVLTNGAKNYSENSAILILPEGASG